ncbi:uncharacterized protein LOC123876323 [Maniola jurtina]|uniref:uncharacterized protein LOC123876323 n=1 Tax=Maniola jurtina TaxID=191418 RepID=UPI001E686307|nr:uncharacterized protein LOC123876323 [Maniola jurtina]
MDKKVKELEEEKAALLKKIKDLAGTALPLMEENESLRTKLANASETPTEHSKICKVTAKLPPFWVDRPVVWFAQITEKWWWRDVLVPSKVFFTCPEVHQTMFLYRAGKRQRQSVGAMPDCPVDTRRLFVTEKRSADRQHYWSFSYGIHNCRWPC